MKKVGILTLSASDNCGSLLQTYALQEYLRQHGLEVKIIDFTTDESKNLYALIPAKPFEHPKRLLFSLCHYGTNKRQKDDYDEYRRNNLNLTKKSCDNSGELEAILNEEKFDAIVCGSDQIWNLEMYDYSDCFFLPFQTKCKKIAYAPSLGGMRDIPEVKLAEVKEWVDDFDKVSVREPSGALTLKQDLNVNAPVLCDPTLLHNKLFWENEAGSRLVDEPYIFYYSWAYSDFAMNKIVQDFSEKTGLKVYVINSSKWYNYRPDDFDFRLFEKSGPDAFLNLMANSEYAFVQSFHGAVFAHIFEKDFCFLNEQIGTVDFRAENFLRMIDSSDRIVHTYSDVGKVLGLQRSANNEVLCELVNKSKTYLDECF